MPLCLQSLCTNLSLWHVKRGQVQWHPPWCPPSLLPLSLTCWKAISPRSMGLFVLVSLLSPAAAGMGWSNLPVPWAPRQSPAPQP